MKRILLVFPLILSLTAAKAQNYEVIDDRPHIDVRQLRFGAYFAPNVSWMKATSAKTDNGVYRVRSNGSRVGYTWGLMMDYFFADNYGISTGFQINNTGGSIRTTRLETDSVANTVYNSDFKYSLQYLEIPFQLKLLSDPIASANDLRVFGQIGLTAGFNIGKKATYEVGYTNSYGEYRTIEGDKEKLAGSFTIAPFLLQLNVGAGIEKPISEKMAFYFGLFFNNAFLPDVTNPNEYDLDYNGKFSDGNIRLNSFAFRLGLFF
jgi:hypothetical protein